MSNFQPPVPVLDARELALIPKLAADYCKFAEPGRLARWMSKAQESVLRVTPGKLLKLARDVVDTATEFEFIKMAFAHAARGFGELTKEASRLTLSSDGVLRALRSDGLTVRRFDEVCAIRSYDIQRALHKRDWRHRFAALLEGVATGAPGLIGVPFNLALSFLLYFRAAQATAMYYGYNARHDPSELEFASEVTLISLAPNAVKGEETLGGLIGKMMLAAELSAISRGLRGTYTQMAAHGGGQLLYVQIRALANKAAKKALENAGRGRLEVGVFRSMLEQVGRALPKEAGKKAVPLLGAVIGGVFDFRFMNRVLKGANLIYHKRFLHEKEARIEML